MEISQEIFRIKSKCVHISKFFVKQKINSYRKIFIIVQFRIKSFTYFFTNKFLEKPMELVFLQTCLGYFYVSSRIVDLF